MTDRVVAPIIPNPVKRKVWIINTKAKFPLRRKSIYPNFGPKINSNESK